MRSPTTVFEGKTNKGLLLTIRYPTLEDLHAMRDYINTLSKEQTFILAQGQEISLEEEQKFLASHLKRLPNTKQYFSS